MENRNKNCVLCNTDFSEEKFRQKIFECGHSTCSNCFQQVSAAKELCLNCDFSNLKSFRDYPVYKGLVAVTEMIRSCNMCLRVLRSRLKDDLKEAKEEKPLMEIRFERVSTLYEKLGVIVKRYEILDDDRFLKYKSGKEYCKTMENVYRMGDPHTGEVLKFDSYSSENHFLDEVCLRLRGKHDIYAYDVLYDVDVGERNFYKWKFGKIECIKDWIHIHYLSLSSVNENVTCVSLQDLKRCARIDSIKSFIDFGSGKIYFTPIDSSTLTLNFLKMCTGENGKLIVSITKINCDENADKKLKDYKDSRDPQDSLKQSIHLMFYENTRKEFPKKFDYDLSSYSNEDEVAFSKNEVIITSNNKCIHVLRVTDESTLYSNVVSRLHVDSTIDINDLQDAEIKDCGICLQI